MPVLRTANDLRSNQIRELYDRFDSPIARLDCGKKCAPHNPSGKPFCCDICHAVPAAYKSEWEYLQDNTQLSHKWRGNECGATSATERAALKADTPKTMVLLACLGPSHCEREYRALGCRQFPFFPMSRLIIAFLGWRTNGKFKTSAGSLTIFHR